MKDYLKKFSLKEKVVFVAGGAGLIGSETCCALASAGAHVIVLDVHGKKGNKLVDTITKAGHIADFEYFDVTDFENLENTLTGLLKKYKKIHGWVNVTYPKTKDWPTGIEKMKIGSLRENVDMHLNTYIWTSRIVALFMQKNKIAGSIINCASIYGVQANDMSLYEGTEIKTPMAYTAIKGGIVNVTRYLASYFGKFNIRANSICPGGIFDHQDARFVKKYRERVPLKRMGTPEDIASTILFLVSDASSYMTGNTVMVDGGWTII